MPKAKARGRKTQDSDEDDGTNPLPQNILELLAKSLATELASKLSVSSQSSSAPPQLFSSSSASAPTAVRTLSTPKLGSPDTLTIPQFRDWKIRWSDFANAQQLDRHPINTQQGILRSALDEEWTMLWSSGRLHINTTANVEEIVDILEAYLRRKRNPLLDRKLFHQRDQMTGESVDRYFAALKTLDDACAHEEEFMCMQCNVECKMDCEYCDSPYPLAQQLQEIRIRDRLICGLLDKEMQRKVLAEQYSSVLTLEKVLHICTAVENSNTVGETLASSSQPNPEVNAIKMSSYIKQQPSEEKQTPGEKRSVRTLPSDSCWSCGCDTRHSRQSCPAKDAICKSCNRKGHYTILCFKKRRDSPSPPPENEQIIAQNNTVSTNALKQLVPIQTQVGNLTSIISWLPDTGSDVDAISESDFKTLGPKAASSLIPRKVEVLAANGIGLEAIGSLPATLTVNGRSYSTTVGVYKNVTSPLLSRKGCIALGFINPEWPLSKISASCCNVQSKKHASTIGKIHADYSKALAEPKHGSKVVGTVYLPSQQKDTLLNDPPPTYPFEQVAADLFSYAGSEYLAYVDLFSGWISVAKCGSSANTSTIIHHLKKWMTDLGIPAKMMSDHGHQFSSPEFKSWTKKWGITHSTSSPQSKGLAESAVKAAKYLLAKSSPTGDLNNEDFQNGLMELRNTPRADGVSPSQLLFGASLCTNLTFHRSRFCDEWRKASSKRDVDATTLREKARQRHNATAKALPHLSRGTIVLIQDIQTKRWTIPAEVVDTHHRGRSYTVRTESGRLLRRNRRFLQPYQNESGESKQQQQPEEEKTLPVQRRRSSRKRNPPQRYKNQLICWDQGSQLPGGHEVSPHIPLGYSRPITRGHVAAWTAERKEG